MSSTLDPVDSSLDIVGDLLRDQQTLTAVEQFSAYHESIGDDGTSLDDLPAQARYYRELLPASAPSPDEQFGFEVDLDKCSGCKACVVACHTLNGLEEDESWRRVGTITIGEPDSEPASSPSTSLPTTSLPAIQHVTTACHHCEDPGCLNGCPVKAYDKDPVTGIVRHLDDQCIGCKYCTMMCPYEVPQYSDRLGIVRKCDMCHQRLSAGEAPACVQACPNEAIEIKIVPKHHSFGADDRLAAGAPHSSITRPTTNYKTTRSEAIGAAIPQDDRVDEVAESHWPLAVMLVATQASVGVVIVERLLATGLVLASSGPSEALTQYAPLFALLVGGAGLNVAPLHLGQPLRAWRVFLGLRTSWLSREAVVLGKYMGALTAAVALLWLPVYASYIPEAILAWIPDWAGKATLGLSIPIGVAGLYSSAMIYIATKRRLWRHTRTLIRFFGSALVLGVVGVAGVAAFAGHTAAAATLGLLGVGVLVAKWAWESQLLRSGDSKQSDPYDQRSTKLVRSHLGGWWKTRCITAAAATVALLLASAIAPVAAYASGALFLLAMAVLLASELAERLLYFSGVVYDRMPGTL